jgi:hypothetical protein
MQSNTNQYRVLAKIIIVTRKDNLDSEIRKLCLHHSDDSLMDSEYSTIAVSTPLLNRTESILDCNTDHGFRTYSTKRLCTFENSVFRCISWFNPIDSESIARILILVDVTYPAQKLRTELSRERHTTQLTITKIITYHK